MNRLYTLILFLSLNFTVLIANSEGQWILQPSGVTVSLGGVYALNANQCWIAGDSGTVLRTSNGGINWAVQKLGNLYFYDVYFANSNYGWIVGDSGAVYRTANGGSSWRKQNSGVKLALMSVCFVNSYTGWAAGDSGIIIKTTNRGVNWVKQNFDAVTKYYSVFFLNPTTGWITGGSTLKTTNAGTNWVLLGTKTSGRDICFIDSMFGWKVGGTYSLNKSTDGGVTWISSSGNNLTEEKSPPATYTGVYFKDYNTGWFTISHSFGGSVNMTTNAGLNWSKELPTTRNRSLYDISMLKTGTGWAVGQNGTIFKRMVSFADSGKYMPLQIGNKWVYDARRDGSIYNQWITVSKITKDTLINSKQYFYCENFYGGQSKWIRYDEFTGQLLSYNASLTTCGNELELFNLKCIAGDSTSSTCYSQKNKCITISSDTTFGITKNLKKYEYVNSGTGNSAYKWNFMFNIGPSYQYTAIGQSILNTTVYTLKGAYINGILYGDTTTSVLTGVSVESGELPSKYYISQNYPNPFNPVSKFKIGIVKSSDVKIVVYDIRGREVQILVNERLQPGTYDITFNGSGLNSGVYFYKMTSGGFTEVKRMVLLK